MSTRNTKHQRTNLQISFKASSTRSILNRFDSISNHKTQIGLNFKKIATIHNIFLSLFNCTTVLWCSYHTVLPVVNPVGRTVRLEHLLPYTEYQLVATTNTSAARSVSPASCSRCCLSIRSKFSVGACRSRASWSFSAQRVSDRESAGALLGLQQFYHKTLRLESSRLKWNFNSINYF